MKVMTTENNIVETPKGVHGDCPLRADEAGRRSSSMKKYELTNERIKIGSHYLYRIRALKDFADVKKGDLGGFVESESNLSQDGDCWVYDNAEVFGNACVCENATVRDEAYIFCSARVHGDATIKNHASVGCDSVVCDRAIVYDNAHISGCARIFGDTQIGGGMIIRGEVYMDSGNYEDNVVFEW